MSRTTCLPVVMLRSIASACLILTTVEKRKALPCWPRKLREMISSKSARWVLQFCWPQSGFWIGVKVSRLVVKYLAAKDLGRIEVYVVCQAHLQLLLPQALRFEVTMYSMPQNNQCCSERVFIELLVLVGTGFAANWRLFCASEARRAEGLVRRLKELLVHGPGLSRQEDKR